MARVGWGVERVERAVADAFAGLGVATVHPAWQQYWLRRVSAPAEEDKRAQYAAGRLSLDVSPRFAAGWRRKD